MGAIGGCGLLGEVGGELGGVGVAGDEGVLGGGLRGGEALRGDRVLLAEVGVDAVEGLVRVAVEGGEGG
jgi:hypothetical protein